MMKYLVLHGVMLVLLLSCKPSVPSTETTATTAADTSATEFVSIPGLNKLWETEKTLTTSESVCYDKANDLLYVSCINGAPPDKKDKDGFIAKVTLDGKIKQLKWVTGLSGPKGMGIYNNTLYVTDIDRLVAIDIASGKITKSWPVQDASFLNDVFITDDGKIYFSDSNTDIIHTIADDKVITVVRDTLFGGANGLLVEGNTMYVSGFLGNNFCKVDLTTNKVNVLTTEIPGGDGVERYINCLLVANWNGQLYHVSDNYEVTMLLDSQDAKLNTADIEVITEKNMLLVPTFFGNNVMAYQLVNN